MSLPLELSPGNQWPIIVDVALSVIGGILILWAWLLDRKSRKLKSAIDAEETYLPFMTSGPDIEANLIQAILFPFIDHATLVESRIGSDELRSARTGLRRMLKAAWRALNASYLSLTNDFSSFESWYFRHFQKNDINMRLFRELSAEVDQDASVLRSRGDQATASVLAQYMSWSLQDIDSTLEELRGLRAQISEEATRAQDGLEAVASLESGPEIANTVRQLDEKVSDLLFKTDEFRRRTLGIRTGVHLYLVRLHQKWASRRTLLYVVGFALTIMADLPRAIASLLGVIPNS